MKINEAEEIIDSMYQNKMCSMEEKTKEGLVVHLGTKVDFTKEEEASVIILREVQILRAKANKYDSLLDKINKKIEEINKEEQELQNSISDEEREEYSDASISYELSYIEAKREILQELLKEEK